MDDFSTFSVPQPTYAELQSRYKVIIDDLTLALNGNDDSLDENSPDEVRAASAIRDWDILRREIQTWANLTEVRFDQDTTNADFKAALEYRDELSPKITSLDVQIQKLLVESELREQLEAVYGPQAFALWEKEINSFDPVIEDDLVQESKLSAKYNELLASAEFSFKDETYNLSSITQFTEDADRETRYETSKLTWGWFAEQQEELDTTYDQMVKLRHGMAKKLGYNNFVELGYQRMARIDYDQHDVERYREEVRTQVVPLCNEIHKLQAGQLRLDKLMFWDQAMFSSQGNPRPQGTYEEQIAAAQAMFDNMGESLGGFFRLMQEKNLMDLKNRPGKAGGGFCTDLGSEDLPFIFANFNGTKGDVEVFSHEMGHAFQCYSSMDQPLYDYVWPTYESCEIHSMSLEFLTWPEMERFFGDQAEQFRRVHLMGSLLFLPYGVAIDHFQHLVYAEPDASPARRHAMWQEVEALYLADVDYGDLPHVSSGGRWQQKRHIYMSPFYYIDYTLAQCCALQFWVRSRQDFGLAMTDYIELCQRGGTLPFQQLTQSAGLKSPFEPGSLQEVVTHAREYLGL
ncbi:MAG: peptidase M3 [Blastopirellula sp.]|nr:MAG: peptidase M3 [Blastopirellula sp.]